MIKTPSGGTTAESGTGSRSGLISNCSIIWNGETGVVTMLEWKLSSVSLEEAALPGGSGDVPINSPLVGKTRLCRVTLLLLLVVVNSASKSGANL